MAQSCSIPVPQSQGARPKEPPPATPWVGGLALDLRSLSLLRVLLALFVLAEVVRGFAHWLPSGQLTDTTGGFSREAWQRAVAEQACWSWTPYLISGEAWFVGLLLALTALAALVMLLGWHTRIATFVLWLLVVSLYARLEPGVIGPGEQLVQVILFWGIFLPLGWRGSLDAALDISQQRPADAHLSAASVVYLLYLWLAQWWWLGLLVAAERVQEPLVGLAVALALVAPPLCLLPAGGDGRRELLARGLAVGAGAVAQLAWLLLVGAPPALYATLLVWLLAVYRPLTGERLRLLLVPLMVALLLLFGVSSAAAGPGGCSSVAGAGRVLVHAALGIVAWLALLPGAGWRSLSQRIAAKPAWRGLVVYYDGDCGFCQLGARIVRTFLALPEGGLRTAQSEPRILEIMERENSWVLETFDGTTHTHYDAFVRLLQHSPSGFLLAPLAGLKPVRYLGERAYRWIAANRDKASHAVSWLHYRKRHRVPGRPGSLLVILALLTLIAIKISALI